MRNFFTDPTSSAALGNFDRELKRMRRDAERVRSLKRSGCLTLKEEQRILGRYKGTLRRLLEEELDGSSSPLHPPKGE